MTSKQLKFDSAHKKVQLNSYDEIKDINTIANKLSFIDDIKLKVNNTFFE